MMKGMLGYLIDIFQLSFQSGVIDISLYLRDGNYLEKTSMDSGEAK